MKRYFNNIDDYTSIKSTVQKILVLILTKKNFIVLCYYFISDLYNFNVFQTFPITIKKPGVLQHSLCRTIQKQKKKIVCLVSMLSAHCVIVSGLFFVFLEGGLYAFLTCVVVSNVFEGFVHVLKSIIYKGGGTLWVLF